MIPEICRGLASEAFYIWRQIAIVKSDLQNLHGDYLDGFKMLDATSYVMSLIKKFNEKLRPFIEHCKKTFGNLSMPSKVSCGMVSEISRPLILLMALVSLSPCTLGYGDPFSLRHPGNPYRRDEGRCHT